MADKTIVERLQPSLLDRLTDLEPGSLTESRDTRVIDIRRLRDIIRRDLSWLLNTSNKDNEIDADRYPETFRSVLNYGVTPVAGDISTTRRAELIRTAIHRAVEAFEPRIREGTLEVRLREEEGGGQTTVYFDIHADMWAQPLPLELYLRSEVDLTTGHLSLEQRA